MVEQEPPAIEWRIDGLAVDGALTMLAGREGEGKSLLALALASAVTRGSEIAGFACKPGQALVVDVENGEREAHRRIHSLRPDPEKLSYCIEPLNLSRELDLLADLLDRVEPNLVVLDSFRPLIPGVDENDSRVDAELVPLRDLVREHQAACILLHHAGKQGGRVPRFHRDRCRRRARVHDDERTQRRPETLLDLLEEQAGSAAT